MAGSTAVHDLAGDDAITIESGGLAFGTPVQASAFVFLVLLHGEGDSIGWFSRDG